MEISNRVKFETTYRQQLEQAIKKYPEEYGYGVEEAGKVCVIMMDAIERGSYNKDSRAIKNTCKILGIRYTYTAIREYIGVKP